MPGDRPPPPDSTALHRERCPRLFGTTGWPLLRRKVPTPRMLSGTSGRVQRTDHHHHLLLRWLLRPTWRGGLLPGLLEPLPRDRAERHRRSSSRIKTFVARNQTPFSNQQSAKPHNRSYDSTFQDAPSKGRTTITSKPLNSTATHGIHPFLLATFCVASKRGKIHVYNVYTCLQQMLRGE